MGDPVSGSIATASSLGSNLGKPQAPAAPDYTGAAYAQANAQHSNQNTPYGSLTWTQANPKDPKSQWTSNINLNPLGQQTLDSQMRMSQGLGNLAEGAMGNINTGPMDLSSVQDINDKAYGALTSRLDPQWAQREEMQKTQLANQGLAPGGEAYTNAMRDFGNQRNDAYQQANLAAIQTMPQTYQLASSTYNQPLNQFNALRTGAQVQNPQFQTPLPGPNLLGAAQSAGQWDMNKFNQEMGNYNAMMGGLFGVAGAGAQGYGYGAARG